MHIRTHTFSFVSFTENLIYLLKSNSISLFKFIVVFFINNKILFIQNICIRISVNCQLVNCRYFGRTLDALLYPYTFLCWKNVFFNVIFDVEYYNMTENQYFSVMFISTCKIK